MFKNKLNSTLVFGILISLINGCGKLSVDLPTSATPTISTIPITPTPVLNQPRFAYVANNVDGTINMYTIDASTGGLNPIDTAIACYGVLSIAVDPHGKYLYAVGSDKYYTSFTIDQTTGALSQVARDQLLTSGGPIPRSITIGSTGTYSYVATDTEIIAFPINQTTGALISSSGLGVSASAMVVDPKENYAYTLSAYDVTGYQVISGALGNIIGGGIIITGTPTPVLQSIAIDQTGGIAYALDSANNIVILFHLSSGRPTQIANFSTGSTPYSVTIDPSGRFLYTANKADHTISMYSITPVTGALTSLGSTNVTGADPVSITVDPSGKFVYVANNGSESVTIFSIDQINGTLSQVGGNVTAGQGPVSVVTTK